MILYRNIIQQAWRNTFRNYWLWIFGLFAAVLTNIGHYNGLLNALDGTNGWLRIWRGLIAFWTGSWLIVKSAGSSPWLFIICLLIVCLVLGLLFLAVNSQILVVRQTQAGLKSGDQALAKPKMGFWQQNMSNWSIFWPTVGTIAAVKAVLLLVLLIISLIMPVVYVSQPPVISAFLYVFLILIFLVLIWLVAVWGRYWLLLFLSGKKTNWLLSAKQAWKMLRQNLVASLEMSIIVALINLLAYLLWIFVIYLLAIPFVLLTLLLIKYLAISQIVLIVLAKLLLLASLLVLVGFMVVLETSLWLSFLNNLANNNITSKVSRIFRRR